MPSNTLLKFTSPCSNVGKDTSARSAALPLLWALRSSLAILAGLNRFGPWKGNTGSSMFKFRTFDKDFSQVYWHIDQAWPGKSRNTENKHPFKSPTGWANQLSKTESEHYTNNQKQTKHNSDPSLEFFLFGMPVTMRTPISPRLKIHPMCLWKLPGKQDAVSTSGLVCDLCPFEFLLHPSLLFDLLVSLLPCLAEKGHIMSNIVKLMSVARVSTQAPHKLKPRLPRNHLGPSDKCLLSAVLRKALTKKACQKLTQVYDSAVMLSTMPKHQAHMRMPHENDFLQDRTT